MDRLLSHLEAAREHWRTTDPVLADLARHPIEPWGAEADDAFTSLCAAIIHQQVSLAAGRTIYGRFVAAIGGSVVPEAVLTTGPEPLRAAGLSGQKTGYILDLADRVADGRLDFAAMADMSDEEAIGALVQVKGIGTWSAKMHLLFHLGRLDVCAWEDLGIRLAVERFYGVPEPKAAVWLRDEARPRWSPYNSVAARVLWNARRLD